MNKVKFTPELEKATGEIEYNMTNDYMFRALFQKNNRALKGLLSALLHVRPDEILSVEITNPIVIGETIQDKEFRLDIKAMVISKSIWKCRLSTVMTGRSVPLDI